MFSKSASGGGGVGGVGGGGGGEAVPVLVLCGLEGSGKTCFARAQTHTALTEHAPTLRNRIDTCTFADPLSPGKRLKIKLVDCSGDGRRWELALGSGVLFFVDGANRDSLPEARLELDKVVARVKGRMRIAVVLNKSDLVTFCPFNDLLHELGLELALPAGVQVFECSVHQAKGFSEAMEWVIFQ